MLTKEVIAHNEANEEEIHDQIPPAVVEEILAFAEDRGELGKTFYRYDAETDVWQPRENPEFDEDMKDADDEPHIEDKAAPSTKRPDFVEPICNRVNATALMKSILQNPTNATRAEQFNTKVNAHVRKATSATGAHAEAYTLDMCRIRSAVMICGSNGHAILEMKREGKDELNGKVRDLYEEQGREYRDAFVKDVESRGYPRQWIEMFTKIAEHHAKQKEQPFTEADLLNVMQDQDHKVTMSDYCPKPAAENASKKAPPAQRFQPFIASTSCAEVSYLEATREIGAIKVANWIQCDKEEKDRSTGHVTKYEVLVRMNEGNGVHYWHIVPAMSLPGLNITAYGEENTITPRPGEQAKLRGCSMENFKIGGIAIVPRAASSISSQMPRMLIYGHTGEESEADYFNRDTLNKVWGETAVASTILEIMKANGIEPPLVPDGATDRTRKVWGMAPKAKSSGGERAANLVSESCGSYKKDGFGVSDEEASVKHEQNEELAQRVKFIEASIATILDKITAGQNVDQA